MAARARAVREAAARWIGIPWSARVSTTLLSIVLATTLVLHTSSVRLSNALLRQASTNLDRLSHDPVNVLVTSSFFVAHQSDAFVFALVWLCVLAPLEQRIGGWRWFLGFALGHVGASLLVAEGLRVFSVEHLSNSRTIDVGWSYGTAALLGGLVFLWHGRRRLLLVPLVYLWLGAPLAVHRTFTDWGHAVALVLGLAIVGPVLVRPARTARGPLPPGAPAPLAGAPDDMAAPRELVSRAGPGAG